MTLELKIGDPWPFESSRGITGRPCEPTWHAVICAPQKEARTAQTLKNAGVEVMYPKDERVRHQNGKKYEYTVPMVSRIVYARFAYAPNWDVLRERRVITGVFSTGTTPVALPDATVRAIMGLPIEQDRLEQERIAAMTPDVGERVQLTSGPFKGFYVDIERSEMGRVWYRSVTSIGAMEGETSIDCIQRLAV